jgi:hypothetical protein
MRGMKDHELEAYIVFTQPLEIGRVRDALEAFNELTHELYPSETPDFIRAARLSGDQDAKTVLDALRERLTGKELRWLEIGLRGYGIIKGKREYKPWRRNAYLSLELLERLERLEPEVRYHAPS